MAEKSVSHPQTSIACRPVADALHGRLRGSVQIRQAIASDAQFLPALERSAAQAFLDVPALSWIAHEPVKSADWHLGLIDTGVEWVALKSETEPIGFLAGEIIANDLHIWEVSVAREAQGGGIGRRLLEHARSWASSHDHSAITLTTFRNVAWNAPFYKSIGFEILPALQTPPHILSILDHETEAGLPMDNRCAMRLAL